MNNVFNQGLSNFFFFFISSYRKLVVTISGYLNKFAELHNLNINFLYSCFINRQVFDILICFLFLKDFHSFTCIRGPYLEEENKKKVESVQLAM